MCVYIIIVAILLVCVPDYCYYHYASVNPLRHQNSQHSSGNEFLTLVFSLGDNGVPVSIAVLNSLASILQPNTK